MRVLAIMSLILGVTALVISLLIVGFAALGYLGVLADVGPNENRAIGAQAISLGLPPLVCGVVFVGLGLLGLAHSRRRAAVKPGDAPDRRGK